MFLVTIMYIEMAIFRTCDSLMHVYVINLLRIRLMVCILRYHGHRTYILLIKSTNIDRDNILLIHNNKTML